MARIAIDLHGGDFGPSVLIPSCFHFFRDNPQHHGVLIGHSREFKSFIHQCPSNIEWIDADPIGELAHKPARLLRNIGHSSIEICFKALKNQDVDVLVSSEHTGVLLALIAKYGKLHSLLNRPVLASWLPTSKNQTVMLDLGASFTATHDQLLAFSAVGAGILCNESNLPSLSLLNVGTEYFKGPSELSTADEALRAWGSIDYKGFIEASEVFNGDVEIVVTDGFTGNSIIKSAEGALDLGFSALKLRLNNGFLRKLLGLWLKTEMKHALKRLDPREANGALLAGSELLVIKSHGNAKEKSFYAAIQRAVKAEESQYASSILKQLDNLLDEDLVQPG